MTCKSAPEGHNVPHDGHERLESCSHNISAWARASENGAGWCGDGTGRRCVVDHLVNSPYPDHNLTNEHAARSELIPFRANSVRCDAQVETWVQQDVTRDSARRFHTMLKRAFKMQIQNLRMSSTQYRRKGEGLFPLPFVHNRLPTRAVFRHGPYESPTKE